MYMVRGMPRAQPVRPLSLPLRRRSHAERSASTRAQLLGAAADLVRDGGVQAASMFEVAKAAGVTPGALQHHFGSKAELMMQVIEHILRSDDANGGATVWLDRDGRVEARTLRLGLRTLDAVEVLQGLAAGDTVLLGPSPAPGARVRADTTAVRPLPGAGPAGGSAGAALSNAMGR